MAEETNYYVNAYLRLKSNFSRAIRREAGKASKLSGALKETARRAKAMGSNVATSSAKVAKGVSKTAEAAKKKAKAVKKLGDNIAKNGKKSEDQANRTSKSNKQAEKQARTTKKLADKVAKSGARANSAYKRLGKTVARQSKAVRRLSRDMTAANNKANTLGRNLVRNGASSAASLAKVGGTIVGVAAIAGMVALVKVGSEFNVQLEDTKMSLGSMFQLYEQNSGDLAANLSQAEWAMKKLFNIAKKSPISFGQATKMYQGAASQLIAANVSMQEQMKFMQSATLLKGVLPDMNATDIGSQLGRVIGGSAGAELEVWKRLQPAILKAGKSMGLFEESARMGAKFTQKFNELAQRSPRAAYDIIRQAVKPLDDLAGAQAKSWSGILSTTQSNMMWLSAKFAAPLSKMKKEFLQHLNSDGLFSDKNMVRIERVAAILGYKFSSVVEVVAYKLESWVQYAVDNWEEIFLKMKLAGMVIAGAIKGAFAFGVAKFAGGALIAGVSGAVRVGSSVAGRASDVKSAVGDRVRQRFYKKSRRELMAGTDGKKSGMTSMLRSLNAARMRGKGGKKKDGVMGGLMSTLGPAAARMSALTAALGPLAIVAAIAAVAFAALGIIVAGIAVYVIANWNTISKSISNAMDKGKLSLIPLITAAYTLWRRLEAVGKAFIGGSKSVSVMSTVLNAATSIINGMSSAVSTALQVFAFGIRLWVILKIGFIGLMTVVSSLITLLSKVGVVDKDSARGASDYVKTLVTSTEESMRMADVMMAKADMIAKIKLTGGDMVSVKEDAASLAAHIKEMLGSDDAKKNKKGRRTPHGPKVNIQNVKIVMDLREHDPDRIMAAFVNPLERMADARIQSYEALDQGV